MVRGAWCVVHGAWCVVRGAWCVVLNLQSRVELEEEKLPRLLEEEVLDGARVGVVDHQREARLRYARQSTVSRTAPLCTMRCSALCCRTIQVR